MASRRLVSIVWIPCPCIQLFIMPLPQRKSQCEHYSRTRYLYPYLSHRDTKKTRNSIRISRTQHTPSERTATRFGARQQTVFECNKELNPKFPISFLTSFLSEAFFFCKVKAEPKKKRMVSSSLGGNSTASLILKMIL
jgi:hypothetical protein